MTTITIFRDRISAVSVNVTGTTQMELIDGYLSNTVSLFDQQLQPLSFKLLEAHTNEPQQKQFVTVISKGREYTGKVIEFCENRIRLELGEDRSRSELGKQANIATIYDPEVIFSAPIRQHATVTYSAQGRPAHLTYLLNCTFKWSCTGTVIIDVTELRLNLTAQIEVEQDQRLLASQLILSTATSGTRNRRRSYSDDERPLIGYRAIADSSPPVVETTDVEYHEYSLGQQEFTGINNVPLENFALPYSQVYYHEIGQVGTFLGYQFVTSKFLPASTLMVLEDKNRLAPLGQVTLPSTAPGKEVNLKLGVTPYLNVTSVVTVKNEELTDQDVKRRQRVEEIKLKIFTLGLPAAATLILQEDFHGQPVQVSHQGTVTDERKLRWTFPLGGETPYNAQLTLTVTYQD